MINKTNGECETKLCYESTTKTRTRFYNGMLLTDEHLRAEQNYIRDALRRLTRHLFGWGVVCGLDVRRQKGMCIDVTPGVAIDCCGNLIEVCQGITINLRKECDERYGPDCIPPAPVTPFTKYLVLRYMEKETDPEPVLAPSDDCARPDDKPGCQHSKIREGYCLELWDNCPCDYPKTTDEKGLEESFAEISKSRDEAEQAMAQFNQGGQQQNPPPRGTILEFTPCSPCGCCEDALGLADLVINCETKTVDITFECRRNVISARFLDAVWSKVRNPARAEMAKLHPQLAASSGNIAAAAIGHERSTMTLQQPVAKPKERVKKNPGLPPKS